MNLIKSLLAIVILAALFIGLLYGAAEEQAIRETDLDRQLINTRIVIVQGGR